MYIKTGVEGGRCAPIRQPWRDRNLNWNDKEIERQPQELEDELPWQKDGLIFNLIFVEN